MFKTVEVGQLTIEGNFNTTDIEQGFSRIESNFGDMENQSNQTTASLRKTGLVVGSLAKGLIAMGVAGIAATTALAVKSPVLAGTMAKIELATLKLSNTIGRQLRPIFESIAGSLLPALNKAFSDNSDSIGTITDKTVLFIEALSDLISLDFEGLLENLDKLFKPRGLPELEEGEKPTPFRETRQTISNILDPGEGGIEALSGQRQLQKYGDVFRLPINALIDFFQFLRSQGNDKEIVFANSNGVVR